MAAFELKTLGRSKQQTEMNYDRTRKKLDIRLKRMKYGGFIPKAVCLKRVPTFGS